MASNLWHNCFCINGIHQLGCVTRVKKKIDNCFNVAALLSLLIFHIDQNNAVCNTQNGQTKHTITHIHTHKKYNKKDRMNKLQNVISIEKFSIIIQRHHCSGIIDGIIDLSIDKTLENHERTSLIDIRHFLIVINKYSGHPAVFWMLLC